MDANPDREATASLVRISLLFELSIHGSLKVRLWAVADSASNVAQSIELLILGTVMQNHVTGMVVHPGTAFPVRIPRPLLDDARHLLGLMTVAIVGILVIKHNAVPRTLM